MKRNNNSENLEFLQEDTIQKELTDVALTTEKLAHALSGVKDLENLSKKQKNLSNEQNLANEQDLSDFEKYLENQI